MNKNLLKYTSLWNEILKDGIYKNFTETQNKLTKKKFNIISK